MTPYDDEEAVPSSGGKGHGTEQSCVLEWKGRGRM